MVTDVNCEKERMYVCESETIVAVVGVWNLAKKKILLFAEIIAYLHVAMILQTTKRQKLITIRQNKLKAVDLSIATEGKFTRLKRFRE